MSATMQAAAATGALSKIATFVALAGLIAAVGCALAGLGAGLGYRFDLWHFRAGIAALGTVFWVAIGTAVVCLLGIVLAALRGRRRSLIAAVLGFIIAAVTAFVPWNLRQTANSVPAIHDISTDLANPPQFARVAILRKKDDHPVAYDGPEVAKLQSKAYPDLTTIVLPAPVDTVFAAARSTLIDMGLELVDSDATQGRLEATATSLVFGFKDDVVVRIVAGPGGTRVDMRSKSRVGRNDFGMNAKRIRAFAEKLRGRLA